MTHIRSLEINELPRDGDYDRRDARLFVGKPSSTLCAEDSIVFLKAGVKARGGEYASNGFFGAYLNRQQARELVAKLNEHLDAAGPEPIVEPECDYVLDVDGDRWDKREDGLWKIAAPQYGHMLPYDFDRLLRTHGPLRPHRIVEKPADIEAACHREAGRMRIGIDLDGVCYDFADALRHYLVMTRGYLPSDLPEPTRWEFYLDWGFTLEEFIDICGDGVNDGVIFQYGAPYPGTVNALERMRAAGHTLHIVTDRNFGFAGRSEHATRRWLDLWQIPFDSLTFSRDKTVVRLDMMIDDKPENYFALHRAGVLAFLQSRDHNAGVAASFRVDSLSDFADIVLQRREVAA